MPLHAAALAAMRHVLRAEPKKVFSFTLGDPASARSFYEACEAYAMAQTGRGFRTLDFWRQLRKQ
jgi:DNA repair protein RecO (recombination protein O)